MGSETYEARYKCRTCGGTYSSYVTTDKVLVFELMA